MALLKWAEICDEVAQVSREKEMTDIETLTLMTEKFASFFGVSIQSAKIRLSELGKNRVDGIKSYVDGANVEQFIFKNNTLKKNQTFLISMDELAYLITTSPFINDSLRNEKILYINKMLVVNNPKFVDIKNYKLTKYALEHADECCLIFDVNKNIKQSCSSKKLKYYLCSHQSNRINEKTIAEDQKIKVLKYSIDSGSHFEMHKHEYPDDFGEALKIHIDHAKRNKIIHTIEDLEYESDVSRKTIYNYINNKTKPDRISALKLCLALKLSSSYIIEMLTKGDCLPVKNDAENNIIFTIIYSHQREGLEKIYEYLKKLGKESILEMSDKWLENHYF